MNSVSEAQGETEMKIFPNPAQNNFTIEFPKNNFDVIISDVTGRKIFEKNSCREKTKINCSNFSDGIYFLKMSVGEKLFVRKIIIER